LEWIELPRIAHPVLVDVMQTPAAPLKAMRLPAPATVPPMVLAAGTEPNWAVAFKLMPQPALGIAVVPVMSVPIRFPCMRIPVTEPPVLMPWPPGTPEIKFPAPAAVPPTVTFAVNKPKASKDETVTPATPPLVKPAVPVALVPIKLP
jgi:hypothetical protein